jgi:enoyl-CoA hydratase
MVLVDRDRDVLVVIINRPEVRNAVDVPTAEALLRALQEYDRDDQASVAVLTGAGGTFCAGRTSRPWPPASSES